MLSILANANLLSIQNSWDNPRLPNRILLYFLPASACAISFICFVLFLFVLGYYYGGIFNLIFSVIYLMTFVFYLLDRVTRGTGRTLVVATHSTQVAARADRVFTIEHGRVVPLLSGEQSFGPRS